MRFVEGSPNSMSWPMHSSDSGFISNYSEVPSDPEPTEKAWLLGVGALHEAEGGGTWVQISGEPQAVQEGQSHLLA